MLFRILFFLLLASSLYACKPYEGISRTGMDPERQKELVYHNRSLRLDPTHGPTYRERGIIYYEEGAFNMALSDFNKALIYKDSSYLTLYYRALVLLEMDRAEDARFSIERAYAYNPDYAPVLAYMGYFQLRDGKPEIAIQFLDKALAEQDSLMVGHLNRGTALYQLGRLEPAIEDFKWVTDRDPFNAIALSNLGLALCEAKRCDEGLPHLDQAISISPNLAEAWYNRGLIRYSLGDLSGAMEDFRKAKSLEPDLIIRIKGEIWEP